MKWITKVGIAKGQEVELDKKIFQATIAFHVSEKKLQPPSSNYQEYATFQDIITLLCANNEERYELCKLT